MAEEKSPELESLNQELDAIEEISFVLVRFHAEDRHRMLEYLIEYWGKHGVFDESDESGPPISPPAQGDEGEDEEDSTIDEAVRLANAVRADITAPKDALKLAKLVLELFT